MSAAILMAAVLTAEEATAEVSAMTQLPMNARKTAQNNCGNLNITIVLEVLLVLLQTWDKLNSRLLGNPDISAQQEPGHSFAHLLIDPTPLCVVTRVNHNKIGRASCRERVEIGEPDEFGARIMKWWRE